MLFKVKHVASVKKIHHSFSLIELLLSLSLGSFLLFTISSLYSDFYIGQHKQYELVKLQKNAHQILDYLQQHLLNTGYQGKSRQKSNFALFKTGKQSYVVEKNCLITLQDLDGDGCLGQKSRQCTSGNSSVAKDVMKEIIAVKVENKQLYVPSKQNKLTPCTETVCRQLLTDCSQMKWERIAERTDSQIEKLAFEWEKEPELLKIELILSSNYDDNIRYQASAYAYLLNGDEE